MARTISGSVGRASANRQSDVATVQELLNQVSQSEGGPQPKLKVDGLCGPKTSAAIQKFQLHHFGWSGADGRVEPGHQTIAKLNEYDQRDKPLPPKFTSCEFTITRVDDGKIVLPAEGRDWFFAVQEFPYRGSPHHVYYLGNFAAPATSVAFMGTPRRFRTNRLHAASQLECAALYKTYQHRYRGQHNQTYSEWRSVLELRLPSGTVRIPFESHLAEMDFDGYRKRQSYERRGTFRLIRYHHRYYHP